MFAKLLIANRGEIACRIMATARQLGCTCVAVYSDADQGALHVTMADEAYRLGPAPAAHSYLAIDSIIAVARTAKVDAIHPGYGFLSESAEFAEACQAAGLTFIGPPAEAIRSMGRKDSAKRLMQTAGVPIVPGYHGTNRDASFLAKQADKIGFPILIKATAGGGGRGMRRVDSPAEFAAAFASAEREAAASFGDGSLFIEKFLKTARHIEVQVFADAHGQAVHLSERDCSLQRRHQKVIEEAPAPGMTAQLRRTMGQAAVKAALAVSYRGAGTVEFIADTSEGLNPDRFYFMEMNTRLQVEHAVTEAITGLDLVEWQLRIAAGQKLPLSQAELTFNGHAFEARIYAEDAERDFLPQTGRLTHLHLPGTIARVDAGVRQGDEITPHYDPMIAKLITHGITRADALDKLSRALRQCRAVGCTTNIGFLAALAAHPEVVAGNLDTGLIERNVRTLTVTAKPTHQATALAALMSLGLLEARTDHDPWSGLVGWRSWGAAEHTVRLEWRGEPMSVRVIVLNSASFEIATLAQTLTCACLWREGDHYRFDFGDQIVTAVIIASARQITVFVDGAMHAFALPVHRSAEADRGSQSNSLISPITGTVRAVKIAAGAHAAKGASLIVIEAMKMEHSVVAPRDGEIAEVRVAAGDLVHEGMVLLRLKEADG